MQRTTFVNFMANLCLQMTYKETPSSLYDKHSMLKEYTTMDEDEYISIWKKIATMNRIDSSAYIGTGRRPLCLWEICERSVNKIWRKIGIEGRSDDIGIALDDDKIWVESSGRNANDTFKLRKVTHNKDNRKGIINHSAISPFSILPLAAIFEMRGDRAVDCFKRLFYSMFPSHGSQQGSGALPDLYGVSNKSDRGYTIESTIFDFLIPAGADINNTCKRIMPFPFLWGMKRTANETRTQLEEKGAPTLYIKEMMHSN
jgi:hypothetical protein